LAAWANRQTPQTKGLPVLRRFNQVLSLFIAAWLSVGMMPSPSPAHAGFGTGGGDRTKPQTKQPKRKRSKKKANMKAIPPDEAAEQAALADLGDAFSLHRTRHYSVLYDTSKQDVETFSTAIEQTYRSCVNYALKLDQPAKLPKAKLVIYYFQEHQDYSDYSEKIHVGPQTETTPGVYVPALNLSMFYNFQNLSSFKDAKKEAEDRITEIRDKIRSGVDPAERRRLQNEIKNLRSQSNWNTTQGGDISESTVQHEVSHQVLWNIGLHNARQFEANPRWFVEGTAMMFETISTGRSANFGALNRSRLLDFRTFQQSKRLIPLRAFISSAEHFGPGSISIAYPEAWAIVHYLNRTKRKRIKTYIKTLNERPEGYESDPDQEIKDFEAAFGKLDEKWEKRWLGWMNRIK
jgi:hypothetical protein